MQTRSRTRTSIPLPLRGAIHRNASELALTRPGGRHSDVSGGWGRGAWNKSASGNPAAVGEGGPPRSPPHPPRPVETFGLLGLAGRRGPRQGAVVSGGCLTASLVHPRGLPAGGGGAGRRHPHLPQPPVGRSRAFRGGRGADPPAR